MTQNLPILFLDSLAIGVVVATAFLCSILLFDPDHTGAVLGELGRGTLTLVWVYLSVTVAPFGTLFLLWQMKQE